MASYDPNKKYTWSPEDKFELSGAEFGIILNSIRAILSTEEARRIILADRANEAIEQVMAKSVEKDIVKEVIE